MNCLLLMVLVGLVQLGLGTKTLPAEQGGTTEKITEPVTKEVEQTWAYQDEFKAILGEFEVDYKYSANTL